MNRGRFIRYFLWSMLSVSVLVASGLWLLQQGHANGAIRSYLVRKLTHDLNRTCHMDTFQGDPLGHFKITGCRIEGLVTIDTLDVRLRVSGLLRGRVVVDSLLISGAEVHIASQSDSAQLSTDTWWAQPPPFSFEVSFLDLSGGQVIVDSGAVSINDIDFSGALMADHSGYRITVERYQSIQLTPPLTVSNFSGLAVLNSGDLKLSDLVLETPSSRLFLSGNIDNLEAPKFDVTFRADALFLQELDSVGFGDLPNLYVKLNGKFCGTMSEFSAEVTAEEQDSKIHATIDKKESRLSVGAQMHLKAFDSAIWLPNNHPSVGFDLDGKLQTVTDSTEWIACDFIGRFSHVQHGLAQIDTLNSTVVFDRGKLVGHMDAQGPVGQIKGQVDGQWDGVEFTGAGQIAVSNLKVSQFPEMPTQLGSVTGGVKITRDSIWHVDTQLTRAVVSGKVFSNITLQGTYNGQQADVLHWMAELPDSLGKVNGNMVVILGKNDPHLIGQFDGQVSFPHLFATGQYGQNLLVHGDVDVKGNDLKTVIGHVKISGQLEGFAGGFDSLQVVLNARHADSVFVEGHIVGPAGKLDIHGWGGVDAPVDLMWQFDLTQVDQLAKAMAWPLGGMPLGVSGTVKGALEKPNISWLGQSDSLNLEGVPMQKIALKGHAFTPDSVAVSLKIGNLSWSDRQLNGVFLDATRFGRKTEFLMGSLDGDHDRFYSWGRLEDRDGGFDLVLDSLHIQADQVALFNEGPVEVTYSQQKGLHLGHFSLNGPAGKIVAQNHPDFKATIEVQLRDLDLRPWSFLLDIPNVDGVLSGDLALSGALSNPLISSEWVLKDGHYNGVSVSTMTGSVSYGQGRILTEIVLQMPTGKPLELLGSFPVKTLSEKNEGIHLNLRSDGFEVGVLDTLLHDVGKISGLLVINLSATGNFDKPVISGSVDFKEGQMFLSALNQHFQPVFGDVQIHNGQQALVNLFVGKAQEGATLTGNVTFNGFDIDRWFIKFHADDFKAINLPELDAEIEGNMTFSGVPAMPSLSGNIVLKQANIHLTDLTEMPSRDWENDPFFRALDMQLRMSADRQVWIRDPDLQVEMVGEVDLVKDASGFRVYGALNSRRGYYTFQNRRLRIESGEIQFQGSEELDPDLNIHTQTEQRLPGNDQSVNIYVNVAGTLTHPVISLSSDPPFEEGDLMAMLVTGRSLNQVSDTQGVGDQALNVMIGVAANQLSQRLGNELNLDLVEVDLGGGNVSRIRVGKYFGSRLFISYAQDISSVGRELGLEFDMGNNITLEAKQAEEVQEETQNSITKTSLGVFWKREW